MRGRRIAFFGLAFIILVALLYTGEAIFSWLLIFMAAILLLGALNILYTLASVTFSQTLASETSERGGRNVLSLELRNNYILPFAHMTVYYDTVESRYGGGNHSYMVSVMPFQKCNVEIDMNCPYRGEYEIGFSAIEATDLFGLIKIRFPFSRFSSYKKLKLLVFPLIREIPNGFLMNRETEGRIDSSSVRAEEISSISDIRGFRDGDSLKRVHWKLSARNQKLLVKEFEGTLSADSVIMVDCTAHGVEGISAAALEDSITECATAFCKRYTDDYLPLKLLTYSDKRDELSGNYPYDFPAFYEHLARIEFKGDLSLAGALKLEFELMSNIGSIVLITTIPDDPLFERLCAFADNDCRISLILVHRQEDYDDRLIRMLGEFAMRGISTMTLLPGENISHRLGG